MSQHGYGHNVLRELLFFAVRLLVGAYPAGSVPHDDVQTLYFPNHGDVPFVVEPCRVTVPLE
ncbi:MAG: hypothetical protein H0W48_16935 [Methylibium sp.]|nr:hypothetical protein [Methylibium sp.]